MRETSRLQGQERARVGILVRPLRRMEKPGVALDFYCSIFVRFQLFSTIFNYFQLFSILVDKTTLNFDIFMV